MAAVCVTPEQCKVWEKSGKSEFVKLCKSLGSNNELWGTGGKTIRKALYEVCWQVILGHLKQEQAVAGFAEVTDAFRETPSLLADVLSVIDTETSITEENAQRERFIALIAACSAIIIPETLLKERLDQDTLESAGMLQSKLTFQQKYVKVKTKLYYKQQKFNLLREENEGYAKLVTELNQEFGDKLTHTQVIENLKCLIGGFDLDPNRVLDIILESFECRPDQEEFFVSLFKSYITEQKTLCHILGFKFHFYENEETPASLNKVAALLLKHGLVELDALYPHLCPSDSSIQEFSQRELLEAKQYARKLSLVVLSDKVPDKKDEENEKVDLRENNQKLGLCEALLNIGAWDNAKKILDRLPEFFGTTHQPIAKALCALVHTVIHPLYKENSGLSRPLMKGKTSQYNPQKLIIHEKIRTFRELHSIVFPMISYIGPYAACDPVLMIKLVRMGKTYMSKRQNGGLSPDDEVAYYGFLNMLDEVLLPGLILLPGNCCISEELWSFLKLFPYELRYRLYGNWKNDTYSHHARLIRVRADCLERAKYIMKRLSKENVKPSGRQLGKLSHSNPGVLFEYVLSRIQMFDNFIGPVVDSLKYLTSLSYDILVYCIIEAVANPDKDRMKHDDTNISLWLQSLANFAGSICRKYQVELAGLLQYAANQLKASKSFDLLILREVVQKMAGIEVSEEITNDQLEAMSGGELLRQEGGYFAQVRNTKKSSTRLKDTLLEHDLALSLCLLMAQQRDGVIYHEGALGHLKLVGKLYDQCQDTFVQFGSFLSMQLSTEEFVKRLPPIDILVSKFHVPPDAAFFLSRPLYAYAITAKFEELRKIDKSNKQTSSQQKLIRYIEASEYVLNPVVELVRPLNPPKVWDDLSTQFYVTFWSLSMYDLCVPSTVYNKQIQQLNAQISAAEDNKDLPQSKKKKEKERCNSLIDKLKDEEKKQGEHVSRVLGRLKQDKENWFISRSTKNETITQFLQLCIFPRCCFTGSDAVYCGKFIHILHDLKTQNFSTLICYDRIFCDVTYSVTSCTENEAHRYGRFLCTALETIMKWHSDRSIYEKECASYPGFVTVFRKGADSNNKADQLDFENYRHVCHKWHFRITKAMVACLESGNYIQIRNALIILTKILQHYPRIMQFGQALERRVDRIRQDEKDKRPDIYALAMGYSGQLKGKKSSWLPEQEFHQKDKDNPKTPVRNNAMGPVKQEGGSIASGSGTNAGSTSARKADTEGKTQPKRADPDNRSQTKKNDTDIKMQTKKSESDTKISLKKYDATEIKTKESKESKEKKVEKVSGEKKESDKPKAGSSSENKKMVESDRKEGSSSKLPKEKDREKSKEEKKEKSKDKDKSRKDKDQPEEKKEKETKHKEDHVTEKPLKEEKRLLKEKYREERQIECRDEGRSEQREKDKKEEKHVEKHVKLKRSYSPVEMSRDRESHHEVGERSSSVASSGSHGSHRRSPDPSPRLLDERGEEGLPKEKRKNSKRRKVDLGASSSKERARGESKERHKGSPSQEKESHKEKKERKRDHSTERNDVDSKKRKSLEPISSRSGSKVNGDSDGHHSKSREAEKSSSKIEMVSPTPRASGSKRDQHEETDESPQRTKSKDRKEGKKDRTSGKKKR